MQKWEIQKAIENSTEFEGANNTDLLNFNQALI